MRGKTLLKLRSWYKAEGKHKLTLANMATEDSIDVKMKMSERAHEMQAQ